MTREELRECVRVVIHTACYDKEVASIPDDDANLFEVGLLDSFSILELLAQLEVEFSIRFASEDLIPQNIWSINALSSLVANQIGNNGHR